MIDRRALSLLLFGGAAGLAGCANEGGPPHGDGEGLHEEQSEMLFISPMGEPFRAMPPAPYPVEAWFKGADTNGDGKLDLPEFLADATRFFHVLDITKDGVIDHREIYYYEHKLVPEVLNPALGALQGPGAPARLWRASDLVLAQYGGGGGGGGGAGGLGGLGGPPVTSGPSSGPSAPDSGRLNDKPLVGAAAYGLLADPEPVQGADIRLTGIITLNDFKTRAEQRFKLLDDRDRGFLTLADLPETQAQAFMPHKGRRGPRSRRA